MNFNIYIEDQLGKQLQKAAKATGKSKNALIREALSEWFQNHPLNKWPDTVLQHEGIHDFMPFESHRDELQTPKDDPLS